MSDREKSDKFSDEANEAGISRLVLDESVLKLWRDPRIKELLKNKKVRDDAWLMIRVLYDSKKAGNPINFSNFGKKSIKDLSKVLVEDGAIDLFEKCDKDVDMAYRLLAGYIQGSLERYDLMQEKGGIYALMEDVIPLERKK